MADTAPNTEKPSLLSNILAIIGSIILIVIVMWGLYHLAVLSKSWIEPFLAQWKKSGLTVTVPKQTVPSGEAMLVSWSYSPKEDGMYAFLYQCQKGFQFKTASTNGNMNAIPCGASYMISKSKTSMSVTPFLTGTTTTKVPLSIIFMPTLITSPKAEGKATVTVGTASQTSSAVSSAPAQTFVPETAKYTGTTKQSVQESGLPDLSVRILSQGVIDPISGDILARKPYSADEVYAVRFDIANNSSASTGTWYFTAELPTPPGYTYSSVAQVSLPPGGHIENMLRFKPSSESGVFSVSVDPTNSVHESNESNNTTSTNI